MKKWTDRLDDVCIFLIKTALYGVMIAGLNYLLSFLVLGAINVWTEILK